MQLEKEAGLKGQKTLWRCSASEAVRRWEWGGHQAKEPHNSLSFFITWRHFPIFNESLKSFSSYFCPTTDD